MPPAAWKLLLSASPWRQVPLGYVDGTSDQLPLPGPVMESGCSTVSCLSAIFTRMVGDDVHEPRAGQKRGNPARCAQRMASAYSGADSQAE